MRTRSIILGALVLLAVLLVAGCGTTDAGAVDEKFQKIDFEFSTLETVNSSYNDREFEAETVKYIELVRRYKDQLGTAEAKQRLTDKADELSSYCLPCVATLSDEARKY
jgi:predicted component of type VI protein secretion system